ncbi:hypothetical protein [Chromobacterium sp. ASV23]|uniref:hypothetical protein n=1 Tax=Chromobacterium sp. ASV23 TaxID=2795110 RepID=UPI0018EB9F10|nr:hypothetical protein [Chromobacterium sp. ASV23]
MSQSATIIVMPGYWSAITGVAAVKISTRKVYTLDAASRAIRSAFYSATDEIDSMSPQQLVDFVNRN